MEKIAIFDTAESSRNLGDQIINDSIEKEMSYILKSNYIMKFPTHTPIINFYQRNEDNPSIKYCKEAKYKFIEGTNLVSTNLFKRYTTWNLNYFNYKPYRGAILIGCGLNPNSQKSNYYTKQLYKKIFNKDYIHSVRDENTKIFIENLGFKAYNTGCPTLWSLTKEFCKTIPTYKKDRVIFTLTDYCRDKEKDKEMLNIIEKNYNEIYFWVQGAEDLEYLNEISTNKQIKIVNPSLNEYKKILEKGNIDYVGTRLHAGIFAMKNQIRSIIIIIDNRARDMNKTNNLVSVERDNIQMLDSMINSEIITDIHVDFDKISRWKEQFNCE